MADKPGRLGDNLRTEENDDTAENADSEINDGAEPEDDNDDSDDSVPADQHLSRRERAKLRSLEAEKLKEAEIANYLQKLGIDPSVLAEQTAKKEAEKAFENVSEEVDGINSVSREKLKDLFSAKYAELKADGLSAEKAQKFAKEFMILEAEKSQTNARGGAFIPRKKSDQQAEKTTFNKDELLEISRHNPTRYGEIMDKVRTNEYRIS